MTANSFTYLPPWLASAWESAQRWLELAFRRLKSATPWELAAAGALVLLAIVLLPFALVVVAVCAILAMIGAWIVEFVRLMRLPDHFFPGRFDKLVWTVVMVALPPIGLIAFWLFRRGYWGDRLPETGPEVYQKPQGAWEDRDWT